MKRKYIYLIGLIIVVFPFLLNIFIGIEHPQNIAVVGLPSDWLLFYGSYVGGILTAIIGYITIYWSNQRSKLQIQITEKQESIKQLERQIAKCITALDYSRTGIISLYLDKPDKYDAVLNIIDNAYTTITISANTLYIIYGDSHKKEIQDFQFKYAECARILIERLNQVTFYIKELQKLPIQQIASEPSKTKRDSIIQKINDIILEFNTFKEKQEILLNTGKAWINTEKQELAELQTKL